MAGSSVVTSVKKVTTMEPPLCWAEAMPAAESSTTSAMSSDPHTALRPRNTANPPVAMVLVSQPSAVLDPRVQQRVHQVRQQIAHHNKGRREHHHPHDDRNVQDLDGLPGQLADARPGKH